MSNIGFQIAEDAGANVIGVYTCPQCGEMNLMFGDNTRHDCSCGRFMIDIGQSLKDFYSSRLHRSEFALQTA